MPSSIALAALLAPVALLAVGLLAAVEPGLRPRRVLRAAQRATAAGLLLAVLAAGFTAWRGPVTSDLLGVDGIGLSVRLDALSVTMFLLVAFIGVIVVAFSRNYLDGDLRQGAFVGGLCVTLAAVILLVIAGNLVQLVASWVATSLTLHRLLVFYRDRRGAVIAARKKFVTARIADLCLILACLLLAHGFHTGDIATLLDRARALAPAAAPPSVAVAAFLLAIAALLKSAQFPTHGWLPEVMETPTPVSALLHAGIINAGGFIVIRLADVMVLCAPALHLLALIGGFTALFGGVVMLTQPSVKVSLAWSTVAQMGFMLLQCGLGAFPIAVLHIVSHSLYKAHAFLSSGSVVDVARGAWVPEFGVRPRAAHVGISLAVSLGLYAGIGAAFGYLAGESYAGLALGAILVMGLTLLIAQAMQGAAGMSVISRSAAAAAGATVAFFVLSHGANVLFTPTLPPVPAPGAAGLAIMALAVASFAAVAVLQVLAPLYAATPGWRAARVHVANGLYVNAAFNRLVGALRAPTATPS